MINTRSFGLLLDGRRRTLALLGAVSFLGGAAEALFLLIVTRVAFDLATEEGDLAFGPVDGIGAVTALAFGLVALRVALAVLAGRMSADLVSEAVASIRQDLADAYLQASWRVQQSSRSGRLQELLTTFVQGGADLLTSATSLVASLLSLVALLLGALVADPVATLAAGLVVVGLGALLRPIRAAIKRRAARASRAGMEFATSLSDTSSVMLESQVFHVQEPISRDVARRVERAADANRRLLFARALIQPAYVGAAYSALLVALVAVYLVDQAALASVATVMVVMLRSLSYGQAVQVSSAAVASNEPFVVELTDELHRLRESRPDRGVEPLARLDRLELRDVSFSYGDDAALEHITVSLEPGVAVGIVGPSGSGKSTLAQVILGLLTPSSGEVLANGEPAAGFDPDDWSRRVTFVPQSPKLVHGTVADNIRFFRPVSDEAVVAAARRAHIHDEIVAMKDGYGQQVIQGALSGGQQQRLCIARALVEDPDLIVLDEPTSALDLKSEQLIGETLAELRRAKTVVIIAHRLSTLNGCDKLMVIQSGRLVGFDDPERLSTTNPFYAEVLRISQLT